MSDTDTYPGDPSLGSASRSFRNNNPGNLIWSPFSQQQGAIDKDANGFAIFPDIKTGQAAQAALWNTQKYSGQPLGQMIGTGKGSWGGLYGNQLPKLGIDPKQTFAQLSSDQQQQLMAMQAKMEGYFGPKGGSQLPPTYPPPGQVSPQAPTSAFASIAPPQPRTLLAMADPVVGDPYAP